MDGSDIGYIIGILICIVLSGFFSASETAYTTLNVIRYKIFSPGRRAAFDGGYDNFSAYFRGDISQKHGKGTRRRLRAVCTSLSAGACVPSNSYQFFVFKMEKAVEPFV